MQGRAPIRRTGSREPNVSHVHKTANEAWRLRIGGWSWPISAMVRTWVESGLLQHNEVQEVQLNLGGKAIYCYKRFFKPVIMQQKTNRPSQI